MVEKEHPDFLWLDGQIIPWDEATVHITALEWGAVGSVYEGLRAYRHPHTGTLYLFRLDDHLARFADSMKMMRMDPPFFTPGSERGYPSPPPGQQNQR